MTVHAESWNRRIGDGTRELLAQHYGVPRRSVRLNTGEAA
jgi:hypothetical protein